MDGSTGQAAGQAVSQAHGTRLLIAALRAYQAWLSPLFGALGARCRFEPSCSQYAIEAVEVHGALRGAARAGWRLLRCNPFNRGGCDPVRPASPKRCFT